MSVPHNTLLQAPLDLAPPAAPIGQPYEARLHTRFETVAPVWRALEADGLVTAYQRADWAAGIAARVAGPAGASPLFVELVERASGRTVMIWPLALVRRRGLRVLTWLDLGVSDYAAPVLAAGVAPSAGAMRAAWAAMRGVLPKADLIRISWVPATVHGRANPLAVLPHRRRMTMQASGVVLDGDPETLLKRLCRPSTLKDFGKQRRRLERAGALRFALAQTPEAVETVYAAIVEQRRRRFAEMGRFDLLARPEIEAFYRERALDGLSGGPARLFSLRVGDTVVAAAYGLAHRDTFHGIMLTTSDDPAWRNASPGMQIVGDVMRWARADGLTYFDFTVGDLPYKRDFGVAPRDLDEIVQPLTLRGALLVAALRGADAAMLRLRAHKALFERARGLRRGLRKVWR